MNSSPESLELLAFAERLALEAGEITQQYFNGSFTPDRKADRSYVTVADREAERYLRERIQQELPDDGILGEEEEEKPGRSGRRWILDPLDGTYSFVHRVPIYGVLIGLEINDKPSLGVVNLPALGELISASKGHGCFWNGERVRASAIDQVNEALVLATSFDACESHRCAAGVNELKRTASATRTWGDCYGHVLVATGRAEVMLDPVMNIWDCAALLPILEEAGGTFTDWKGRQTIHGGEAVSTNGRLFEEVMSKFRAEDLNLIA
jgi:histidinol-phosphatase